MFTVSLTIDDAIGAFAGFLSPLLQIEGVPIEIVRGQANKVPPPLGNFCQLTEMGQFEIETPSVRYDRDNGAAIFYNPCRLAIQVDLYGRRAGDFCRAILLIFRSEHTVSSLPSWLSPLYCSDGMQAALINSEMQYQDRWTFTAHFQFSPTISVPQSFAETLAINIFENVDTEISY